MASPREFDKLPSDTGDLETISGSLSKSGMTEEHLPDKTSVTVRAQKSGKLRTALTFFGVRKSMCLLPSFFGGRGKNQSKWASKKGIYKSKTHDGLSQICRDDSPRSGSSSTTDFQYRNQADCTENPNANEGSPPTEQKFQSLTRQKRGFKSFFNSFKHQKNHRNDASDKTEMIAMSSRHSHSQVPPVLVPDSPDQYVTHCLESEPDVPDFANTVRDSSPARECHDADAQAATFEKSSEDECPKSQLEDQLLVSQTDKLTLTTQVASQYKESARGRSEPCLLLETAPDPTLKSETPVGSSDQLNMIYGEVASLKSFDSLTGCGDITADQEDDSISDTTVSGERSRNGGKRASCFLTYQGGGEEMASPEDLGEQYLGDFWGNNPPEDLNCPYNQAHVALSTSVNAPTDLLTPQSEHQGSVPNSDEGYYDSSTPGQDEGHERTEQLRQANRLPRDSYSGDALYELFATDESLVSPHNECKPGPANSKQNERLDGMNSTFSESKYKAEDFVESRKACKSFKLTQNTVAPSHTDWSSKAQAALGKKFEAKQVDERGNGLTSSSTPSVDCENSCKSDPDFETLANPKAQNREVALALGNSPSLDRKACLDDGQTVCFSQALVNYEKSSQMLRSLHGADDNVSETNADFTPNMEDLPAIVTFDVVDLHNEGEYDDQIHMELEEDISSPYQEFEDSYLQKDAFAECDYQMLDFYEQSLISNAWAIASLPRHLGLARFSQSTSNPLSLDKRSRSLDTESLPSKMPASYREGRGGDLSRSPAERDPLTYCKKNEAASASEVQDGGSAMALPWLSRSEVALSLPPSDRVFPESLGAALSAGKSHLCPDGFSQDAELYRRPCHLLLQSDSHLPHGAFVYSGRETCYRAGEDAFCKAASAADLQSYVQFSKSRQTASRERTAHSGSSLRAGAVGLAAIDKLATNSPK
ncbi:APC membrane recruitment protein 1-like [Stigmatopora argus]